MRKGNLKNLSEEEYDRLPKWENRAMNLVRRYGCLWDVFDYKNPSYEPWTIAYRLIKANIGKPFSNAFSKFCNIVEFQDQDKFLREFEDGRRWADYYIDDNGLIQETNPSNVYKGPYYFRSDDYKTEWRHKVTGHKQEDFEEVYKKVLREGYRSYTKTYYSYYNKDEFLYYEYGSCRLKLLPAWERYKAQKEDFELVVISGWEQQVASKNDPRFQRYHQEKKKASRKQDRKTTKLSDEHWDSLISKWTNRCLQSLEERKRKQTEELKKAEDLNNEVIVRHGFDPLTSFR